MYRTRWFHSSDYSSVVWVSVGIWATAALVFGWFTYLERHRIMNGWKSRRWIATEGRIVKVEDSSFEIDAASQYLPTKRVRFVEQELTVEYFVDGRRFRTQNYSFGGHSDQPMNQYNSDQSITVYYDPERHRSAVVRKGLPFTLILLPLGSVVTGIITLVHLARA